MKYFTIGVVLLSLSCNSAFNNNDREKLVFKDKASNIQHALMEISNLIRKMPSNTNGFNTTYGFFDNQLEINKTSERSADSTHIITLQALESLTTSQKSRFIKLATYLNDNNLSSGYLDQELNLCVFLYHSSRNTSFDDLREVIIVNEDSVKLLYKDYKILDHEGMLYLIAPLRE